LAIAEVTDGEKLKQVLGENKIDSHSYEIVSYGDFEMSRWRGRKATESAELSQDEKTISVNAFDDSSVSMDFDPTKQYFAYRHSQDCDSNEDGETIYDESVEEEIDTITKAASGLLVGLHVSVGCGYNG
jgi:hypothetical protein